MHVFTSADGPIFIQHTGNLVIAVESFDESMANRLLQTGVKDGHASAK